MMLNICVTLCCRWRRDRSAMSGLVRMAIDRYVNLVQSISGEWYHPQTHTL